MAFSISCPACQGGFKVDEQHIGKRVECPRCGQPLTVGLSVNEDEPVVAVVDRRPVLPIAQPVSPQWPPNAVPQQPHHPQFAPPLRTNLRRARPRHQTAFAWALGIATAIATAIILSCAGLLITTTDSPGMGSTVVQTDSSMPSYEILNEQIVDTPIKAEVTWNILVSGSISEGGLQKLLEAIHKAQSNRGGFKFYGRPSNVFVFAFTDHERAANGMGQWIAMLRRVGLDGDPEVDINKREFAGRKAGDETKLGMSEQKRRALYQEYIHDVDDRATNESLGLFPLMPAATFKVGDQFTLTSKTPLCADYIPTGEARSTPEIVRSINAIERLPAGTRIVVQAVIPERVVPWYKVTATDPNGSRVRTGWINSVALIDQTRAQGKANFQTGIDYDNEVRPKYRAAFLEKHGLSEDQWEAISLEGINEDWTFPE